MDMLVVGAAGQLGAAMMVRLAADHRVTPCTRRDVDLTNHRDVRAFVLDHRPAAIVNCAAYNTVDGAEDDPQTALDINAMVVRTLARAAEDLNAVLVHFSTDFVFAGTATTPYTEADAPEPQSVYAQSKLVGEWLAADWARHYVLRVESLFGGPQARSSIDRIADAVLAGRQAPVFVDRIVSPSYVDDVTEATARILERGVPFGLYHCVNTGVATWWEVGQAIARRLGRPESALKAVSVNDVQLRASRPRYAGLSNARLAAAGITMPWWQDALDRYLTRRQQKEGWDVGPGRAL